MIRSEDHRRLKILQILQAVSVDVGEDSIQRQQKSRQKNPAGGSGQRAAIPGRESRASSKSATPADLRFIQTQRNHALHAFERSQVFERHIRIEPGVQRARRSFGNIEALQLAGSFGARKFVLAAISKTCECAGSRTSARWRAFTSLRHSRRVPRSAPHARDQSRSPRHRGRPAVIQHALHILGENIQALRRDDHFLLAAQDAQLAILLGSPIRTARMRKP